MLPWLDAGNASSLHADGRRAKAAIDEARETVSEALGCLFAEVLFTSGGTEAANTAIIGTALANDDPGRNRVLLGAAEHHCVLHTKAVLERLGYRVDLVPVDREARVDVEALRTMLDSNVLLVSTMHANNELGTLNDVRQIAEAAHAQGASVHCDAVQTFGKQVRESAEMLTALGADLLTVSAHKLGGPKGAGAIYIRAGQKVKPLISGGGQERELRGGTENVAAIVGFAAAVRGASARTAPTAVRDRFLDLLEGAGAVPTVADRSLTLGGHAHVRFPGVSAETLLILLDRMGVSASSGAACSSGSIEPSHVLLACGYSAPEAKEGIRFTFGPENTLAEAEEAAARVRAALERLRK